MTPALVPLKIIQGATLRDTLRIMQPRFEYRPITAIAATAPVRLTCDHGLPAAGLNPMGVYAASGEITPVIQVQGSIVATARFAQAALGYSPPTGFLAWG